MKRIIVDTNVFLRFLLEDVPQQAEQAEKLFKKAKHKKIEAFVPGIVVFEVQFTLEKYYGFSKEDIVDKLSLILSMDFLNFDERKVFLTTLEIYKDRNVSFADYFLVSKSEIEGMELFTFDKKLKNAKTS